MKVKELIEKLSEFDPELEVRTIEGSSSPFNNAFDVESVYEIKGHTEDHFNACFIVANDH